MLLFSCPSIIIYGYSFQKVRENIWDICLLHRQRRNEENCMNRILIIDDDKELCLLIKQSVRSEDIEADFCTTGKKAWKN